VEDPSLEIAALRGVGSLNSGARTELLETLKRFAGDVVDEAERLEANHRAGGGQAEITQWMIRDATLVVRRSLRRPRPNKGIVLLRVSSYISLVVVGVVSSQLKQGWGPYAFAVAFVVTVLLITWRELVDASR
jgi:hypothetical protein